MARRGALERGHVKVELSRLLATGEHSQTDLAARFGVTPSAISRFAQRYAERIADVAGKLDDEFAGLWIAEKAKRIGEYQEQVDAIADLMSDPESAARAGVQAAEMWRTAQSALKAVAEELGQLPNRMSVKHEGGVSVRYEIVGADMDALR